MKCKQLALRVLSTAAVLSIVSSIAAPVFAETYYIGNGYDLKIEAKEDGKVYVNDHEDQDGEITIKGSAGEDSLSKKNEENKEQETGENSGTEKQSVTEETPGEKNSAEEGKTKKPDTPSENSDEENEGKDPANENKKDDAPAAEENDPQPEDTAEPEEKAVKKEAADSGENAPAALQSTAAAKSAPEKNTSVEKSPVSNVIKVVNNWADKILKITLDNVNIKADKAAMSISGSGNVTLELDGKNKLQSGMNYAGLSKNNGDNGNDGTLTIQDKNGTSGSLESHGGAGGAGIGSDISKDTSHIVIDSGEITAVGGIGAAGIGGGNAAFPSDNGRGRATDITIAGGTVKAEGGAAGEYRDEAVNYYTASTGAGAGIGSGGNYTQIDSKYGDDCYYDITIKGGDVTATTGVGGAAGIGGGSGSGKGKIEIKDNAVISAAEGSGYGAGIGSGYYSLKCNITISGGTIKKALGGAMGGAGIGEGGRALNHSDHDISTVKITGGSIGEFNYNHKTKKWEWVKGTGAIGQNGGAGIGTGSYTYRNDGCNVSITGTVNVAATGGKGGVAIGKGANKENNNITNTPPQDTFTKDADAVLVKPNEGAEDGLDVTLLTRLPEPAHDHKWTDVGDHHECDVCGETGSHNWTDNGDGTHKCDECGANENHTWIDNKDGTHTCTGCGTTESMPADTQSVLELWVTDAEGVSLPFAVNQSGSVRTYTSANDTATLTGSMEVLSYLQEHGAETIEFVTNGQTSRFSINDVLAQGSGNDRFYLTHNGSEEATLLVVEADHSEIVYR